MRKRKRFIRKIGDMTYQTVSLLALLRRHASEHGDRLAHQLPHRTITYRRLWSRIERASARLQGEWGVQAGATLAYVGNAHPDAMVLYFALLRIGAVLLPLEGRSTQAAQALCSEQAVSLVVHDEGRTIPDVPARPLALLLEDWCHFDPVLVPDDPAQPLLWLAPEHAQPKMVSLNNLCVDLPAEPHSSFVGDRLFTTEMLTKVVFPCLYLARPMQFAAIETLQKSATS